MAINARRAIIFTPSSRDAIAKQLQVSWVRTAVVKITTAERALALATLALLLVTSVGQANPTDKTLTLGYAHWPPFFVEHSNGEVGGVNADIIRAALQPAGYNIRFMEMPWARGLRNVMLGQLDMMPSASVTKQRLGFGHFSKPYYQELYVLFVSQSRRQDYDQKTLAQLLDQGFRLGVFKGTDYGQQTMALINNLKYQEQITAQTKQASNYRMLSGNRLDGFIQEYSEYRYHQEQNPEAYAQQVVPLMPINTIHQHVLFSRHSVHSKVVEDFNQGLEHIIANGQYREIFTRWGAQAWMLPQHLVNNQSPQPATAPQ